MKNTIILILVFLYNSNLYSYDCKTISKEKEYSISNLIILGKITSVNSIYFEVKVLEIFKGNTQLTVRFFVDYCSIYPIKGETWILYSQKNKDRKPHISTCGNSRSFNFPFNNNSLNFPTPPPIGLSDEVLNLISEKDFKIAKLELEYDIKNLRFIKTKNEINLIKNENENLKTQIIYLKSFIGFFILIILILFFIIRTKKKSNNID